MGIIHAVNLSSTRTCAFFAQVVLYRDLEYDTTRHVTVDYGIDERLVRHACGLRHFLDAVQVVQLHADGDVLCRSRHDVCTDCL